MDQIPPKEHRPPVNLRIKFRSETVEQFIERYAVDVSRGGIFIRTRDPLAVGTHLKLDFQFQGGSPLMSGDGTVVWIREPDPNRASVPPGMGVRFDKLTPESQAVLEQLLSEKSKRERGAIAGAAGTAGGGPRRPSSMFSALDPQVSVGEPAKEKPADKSVERSAENSAEKPAEKPAERLPGVAPGLGDAHRPAVPRMTPPQRPAATGAARAAAEAAGAGHAAAPAPKAISGLDVLFAARGAQKHPTPTGVDGSFDDGEDPTQIAGRLPSFLTSDEEATTVSERLPPIRSPAKESPAPGPAAAKVVELRPGVGHATSAPDAPHAASATVAARTARTAIDGAGSDASNEASGLAGTAALTPPSSHHPAAAEPTSEANSGTASPAHSTGHAPAAHGGPAHKVAGPRPARRPRAALIAGTVIVLAGAGIFISRFFASQRTEDVSPVPRPAGGGVSTAGPEATPGASGMPAAAGAQPAPPGAPSEPAAAGPGPSAASPGAAQPSGATATTPPPPAVPSAAGEAAPSAKPSAGPAATPPAPAQEHTPTALKREPGPSPDRATGQKPAVAVAAPAPAPTQGPSVAARKVVKHKPVRTGRDSGDDAPVRSAGGVKSVAKPVTASSQPETGGQLEDGSGAQPEAQAATGLAGPAPPTTLATATASSTAGGSTSAEAGKAAAPAATATGGPSPPAAAAPANEGSSSAGAEAGHEIRVTSKPVGADVALDGVVVGKTPYAGLVLDVSAPHAIAVKKDGFEPFEQMISASSAWTKTKLPKGKPGPQVLKITAKLRQVGIGPDGKPAADLSAPSVDIAPKGEGVRQDRPLPPSEEGAAKDSPP